ncbi:ABC-type branched-subunit amino acid transport system substrate-binding protein [Bradyrhizobium sp. i1.4.4]
MRLAIGTLIASLAICGGGSVHAQISGDTVKIGVLTDMSGIVSDATGEGSVVAAQLAAEEFGNRVAGKPIQIVFADHQLKPDVGANIVRKWFEQEGVDAIADIPNSAVALAVQELARTRSRIILFSSPGTTALTNQFCSSTSFAWTFDTYALARGTAKAVVEGGGKTWYFITADYAFGHQLQKDASAVVGASGGKVLGASAHPQGTTDFASFLLQAQASKANIVGLANAAGDTISTIKQAEEFGLAASGQKMAAMLLLLTDVHSLGLQATQGTFLTTPYYWDLNDATRDLVGEVRGAAQGTTADVHADRSLRSGPSLPPGRGRDRHRRGRQGGGENARDGDREPLHARRCDPRGRPGRARHVPGGSQSSQGLQGRVGPLPNSPHYSSAGSNHSAGRQHLPARETLTRNSRMTSKEQS